ncbi:hypothetical protein GQ600_4360 [Phytophthora cactorum]|nr:hypothetical protein GQ600_4360 [Phytophthora cactorum]
MSLIALMISRRRLVLLRTVAVRSTPLHILPSTSGTPTVLELCGPRYGHPSVTPIALLV